MSRQLLLNGIYTKGMKFGCIENFIKAFWIKTAHVCMHAYAYGHTEHQIDRGMACNMMHMRAIYRELLLKSQNLIIIMRLHYWRRES